MKKVHRIFGSQENDFNFFPDFKEGEQATVEQPREEPATQLATPTPTDDGYSPPFFLKERKKKANKESSRDLKSYRKA